MRGGALILLAAVLAFALFTDRRADLREAEIEALYQPLGHVIDIDGKPVHVIVKGSGPDLVLIHGAGGNTRDFTFRLTDQLSDRYRVFVVDRPGLGWSAPLRPAASPEDQARHLAKATRALGAENPIVLGHSYGAAVAMAWALNDPTSALVIVSGATMPWPGPLRPYYRIFGSKLGGWLAGPLVSAYVGQNRLNRSVAGVFAPAPTPDGYVTGAAIPLAIRSAPFRESAAQVKALRPEVVKLSADYHTIQQPVEIIHGLDDTTVYADIHAIPLSKVLPDASLTLLEGVGHAPHHVEPDTVLMAIDRAASRAGLR